MGMLATMVMEMINKDSEDKGRNIAKLFGHLTKIFVDATTEESAPLLDPVKRRIDRPRRVNHLLIRQTDPCHPPPSPHPLHLDFISDSALPPYENLLNKLPRTIVKVSLLNHMTKPKDRT